MHILGLQGMPRRIYTYSDKLGLDFWNMVATIGAFTIALSTAIFMYNVAYSRCKASGGGRAPTRGTAARSSGRSRRRRPAWNFDEVPTVHDLDDFWHRKYTEDDEGRLVASRPTETAASEGHDDEGEHATPHLPTPSYFPLVAAAGLPIIAYGMVYGRDASQYYAIAIAGFLVLLTGLFAWAIEPGTEPEEPAHVEMVEVPALVGADTPALEAGATSRWHSTGRGRGLRWRRTRPPSRATAT